MVLDLKTELILSLLCTLGLILDCSVKTIVINLERYNFICLTSLTCAKCGVRSTLCWKIPNISGSIELFAL